MMRKMIDENGEETEATADLLHVKRGSRIKSVSEPD